jgi:hypothetical protein
LVNPQTKPAVKILSAIGFALLLSSTAQSQFMVTRLIGRDAENYGTGYGLFTFIDIPLAYDNQSFRIELMDVAFFPTKGDKFFESEGGKAYISIRLGFKHVFSETATGFYVLPSAGYCRVIDTDLPDDENYADGIAAALEGGYSLEVGERGHSINAGLKYEYDRGNSALQIHSIGLKLGFAFGLGRRNRYW